MNWSSPSWTKLSLYRWFSWCYQWWSISVFFLWTFCVTQSDSWNPNFVSPCKNCEKLPQNRIRIDLNLPNRLFFTLMGLGQGWGFSHACLIKISTLIKYSYKNKVSIVKWVASSRWSCSLFCAMTNLDRMTKGETPVTLSYG